MNKIIVSKSIYLSYFYELDTLITSTLFIDNKEVGSFYFYLKSDLENAYLESFLIKEDFLNKGYGKILAKSVLLLAKEKEFESIFLHAKPFNHSSRTKDELMNFYEKHLNMNMISDDEKSGYYMCSEIY